VLGSMLASQSVAIRGVRYRADGVVERSAVIAIDDRARERAASLAAFLVDGIESADLREVVNTKPVSTAPKTEPKPVTSPIVSRTDHAPESPAPRSNLWLPLSVMGAGAVMAGVGGFLLWRDGRATCSGNVAFDECPTVHVTSTEGYVGLAAGIVAIGIGASIFLFSGDDDDDLRVSIAPTLTGGMASARWRF